MILSPASPITMKHHQAFTRFSNNSRSTLLAITSLFALFFLSLHSVYSQITDSEASAVYIASIIATDSGGSADEYIVYARKLAKVLGQLSSEQQVAIFGFLPGTTSSDNGGSGDTGEVTVSTDTSTGGSEGDSGSDDTGEVTASTGTSTGGSGGDDNNGHGNDPDGYDESNPGKGKGKGKGR